MAAINTIAISKCVGATTTGTYTYTNTTGTLIAGLPIIVTGFVAHTTFNGYFLILTVVNTSGILTFTATITSTTATETISAAGTVDPEGIGVYPSIMSGGLGYGITTRETYATSIIAYGDTTSSSGSNAAQIIT